MNPSPDVSKTVAQIGLTSLVEKQNSQEVKTDFKTRVHGASNSTHKKQFSMETTVPSLTMDHQYLDLKIWCQSVYNNYPDIFK